VTEQPSRVPRSVLVAVGLLTTVLLSGCAKYVDGKASIPGVVPTVGNHAPATATSCNPATDAAGVRTVAQVPDPAAPRITITVPDKTSTRPGRRSGMALTLLGPGLTGMVKIEKTTMPAAAAFGQYTTYLTRSRHQLDAVEGASFCGYSSQKLTGTLPTGRREFSDRLTYIPTDAGNYLVTIHLQGRAVDPRFDAAKAALMQDFAVVIP
jgi:hypothetical protein